MGGARPPGMPGTRSRRMTSSIRLMRVPLVDIPNGHDQRDATDGDATGEHRDLPPLLPCGERIPDLRNDAQRREIQHATHIATAANALIDAFAEHHRREAE